MALTTVSQRTPARAMVSVLTVTGDTDYPFGGYALTAINFGFTELSAVIVQAVKSDRLHLDATWDPDTEKLMFLVPGSIVADDSEAVDTLDDLDLTPAGGDVDVDEAFTSTTGTLREIPPGGDASGFSARVAGIGY